MYHESIAFNYITEQSFLKFLQFVLENQKASFSLFFLKPCKLFQTVTFVFRNNNKKQLHKKINNTKILENQAIVLHLSLKKIYLEFNFLLLYLLMLKTLTIA